MLFSVIIPAYNAENFIKRSINSVLNQTYTDFELIIVNDGSTDKTVEYAKAFNDNRIIVIDKINEGVSIARNTGINIAKGEFICFLDADDEYLPEHLSVLSEAIKKNKNRVFFASRFCISLMSDSEKVVVPNVNENTVYYENVIEKFFYNPELLWTGCVCIKRTMFERYGMFEPGVKLGEDTDMWRRVYIHTGVVCINVVTVKRNRDGSEATRQYTRLFNADPLNRMPVFLNDTTIPSNVKSSLKKLYEFTKLQVVRSYLYIGDKRNAINQLKLIDKSKIPKKRLLITILCFFIPSCIIRYIIKIRNKGLYE